MRALCTGISPYRAAKVYRIRPKSQWKGSAAWRDGHFHGPRIHPTCHRPEGPAHPLPGSKAPVSSNLMAQRPEGPAHPLPGSKAPVSSNLVAALGPKGRHTLCRRRRPRQIASCGCIRPEGPAHPLPGSKAPVSSNLVTHRPEGLAHPLPGSKAPVNSNLVAP